MHAEIDAVALSNKDTHFRHTITDWLYIAKVSGSRTGDSVSNSLYRSPVTQFV